MIAQVSMQLNSVLECEFEPQKGSGLAVIRSTNRLVACSNRWTRLGLFFNFQLQEIMIPRSTPCSLETTITEAL
jgi:hypothetical protein